MVDAIDAWVDVIFFAVAAASSATAPAELKFQCIGMPFGLAPAPRLATKMMAPVIRYLRSCGLRLAIYIDDLILLS